MGSSDAYSMINQDLQNSISKKAYLEKTSEELKELKVKGCTTNLVVICDDVILVGVSTRATCVERKGIIILNEKAKTLKILAVIAGDDSQCTKMLSYVKEMMEDPMEIEGASNGIRLAIQEASRYCNGQEKIDGQTIIVGWEKENGSPLIYLVDKYKRIEKSTPYEALMNGSGGLFVYYYSKFYRKCNNREDILKLMKMALLFATLFDENSSGILRVGEMRSLAFNETYTKPVLEALRDYYDDFTTHLSHSLFSLWYNGYHKYTKEFNETVDEAFSKKFSGYRHSVVIGLHRNFTVLLVQFECSAAIPYKRVELVHEGLAKIDLAQKIRMRHLDDNTVPRLIRDLPWVLIDEFGASPILFGKTTLELMNALQNA